MCGNYSREETTVFTVSALQRQLAILAFGIVIGHGFGCSPSINLHTYLLPVSERLEKYISDLIYIPLGIFSSLIKGNLVRKDNLPPKAV